VAEVVSMANKREGAAHSKSSLDLDGWDWRPKIEETLGRYYYIVDMKLPGGLNRSSRPVASKD
jgi:hypothetical protein